MKVVYSPLHVQHNPQVSFDCSQLLSAFEHAQRGEAIHGALAAAPEFEIVAPSIWGEAPIERVHTPDLVRFLRTAWDEYQWVVGPTADVMPEVFYRPHLRHGMPDREPESILARLGRFCFEASTPLTQGTYRAAVAAVEVALSATELVLNGEQVAYGLCRPPGHHATSALYGGYCYFNNVAVAAHHVAATTGARVAVLDVDYHHGNGTQEIFYARGDVLYVSLHGDPKRAYPWHTGYADETGTGAGLGANCNLPLAAATADEGYLQALELGCQTVRAFGPSLLIVSLGVDTFVNDPLGDFCLSHDGLRDCGALVAQLGLPTVLIQEGGYGDLTSLGDSVRAWLLGFAKPEWVSR